MNKLKEQFFIIKNRIRELSSRDKNALLFGFIVIIFYLIYILIISPTFNHLTVMRKKVSQTEQTLAWMKSADKVLSGIKKTDHTKTHPESLVSFLSMIKERISASSLSKSLTQLKQNGTDSVEITFQKVNFDQAILFVSDMLKDYDIHVAQFNVTALNSKGLTNISMILSLKG